MNSTNCQSLPMEIVRLRRFFKSFGKMVFVSFVATVVGMTNLRSAHAAESTSGEQMLGESVRVIDEVKEGKKTGNVLFRMNIADLYQDREIFGETKVMLLNLLLDDRAGKTEGKFRVLVPDSAKPIVKQLKQRIESETAKHARRPDGTLLHAEKSKETGLTAIEVAARWVQGHIRWTNVGLDTSNKDKWIFSFQIPGTRSFDNDRGGKDGRDVRMSFTFVPKFNGKEEKPHMAYSMDIRLDHSSGYRAFQKTEEDKRLLTALVKYGHPEAQPALDELNKEPVLKKGEGIDELFNRLLTQALESDQSANIKIYEYKDDATLVLSFHMFWNGNPAKAVPLNATQDTPQPSAQPLRPLSSPPLTK